MYSPHKHSYLQSRSSGINPRIINRTVSKAMDEIVIDGHDFEPPYLRLTSHLPYTPIGNVDITRRPCAFGRWAMPLLRRQLHSKDEFVRIQAITTISDLCHDPEKAFEAVRLRVPDRMADLLLSENYNIRERTTHALLVIANQAEGKAAITRNKVLLHNLADLLTSDVDDRVRLKTAELLEMISFFWVTGCDLVEYGFLHYLMDNLEGETDEAIVMRLKVFANLMTTADAVNEVMELEGYTIFLDLLKSKNQDIVFHALKCLELLTTSPIGKNLFLENKVLRRVYNLLFHTNPSIYSFAASLLMFGTVHSKVKIKCPKFKRLIPRLLELCKDRFTPYVQFYAIKTLTNIAEFPPIRKIIRENNMDEVKAIIVDGDEALKRHKEILIKILKKTPGVFDVEE